MPSFRFRLQRVLDWQQKVCQSEEERLRGYLEEVARCQENLARLAARNVATENEFLAQRDMIPPDLKAFAEFRRSVVRERAELTREHQKSEALVTEQRQRLLVERRRLQVFEKLRERAWNGYTLEAERELERLGLESYVSALIKRRSTSQPE